jgi:hypothetical protein
MSHVTESCPAELPNWCAQRHWSIFWILIVASVALLGARILALGESTGRDGMPFFSANDRSRWITVRALVDHGTFAIDPVLATRDGRKWDTIDKVRHIGRDGQFHFYSSKPPMLTLLFAGGYQLGKWLFGWELATQTNLVVRSLLFLFNITLWAVFLWFLARFINSVPVRDWTRYFVLGCAGFATFLFTFGNSLTNHLPAAVGVVISLYCTSEIVRRTQAGWGFFAAAGLMGALAVANELPALCFLVAIGVLCLWQSVRLTALAFAPMVFSVAVAWLACNWLAWGQILPAYSQRQDGSILGTLEGDFDADLNRGVLPDSMRESIESYVPFSLPVVEMGAWPETPNGIFRWVVRDLDPRSTSQLAIVSQRHRQPPATVDSGAVAAPLPGSNAFRTDTYELRAWGNWYDYPGSYWLDSCGKKSEVDRGESSIAHYAFHLLFGRHGIVSLTPLWLLSFAGMFALIGGAKMGGRFQMRWLGLMGLFVSVVVFSFYLTRPTMERNYGGVCCYARWLLWLSPIWLTTMLPVVDWLGGTRAGKCLCFCLMFLSALSANFHANNPWTLPWLYQAWEWANLPG